MAAKHLLAWGEGLPLLIRMFAQQAAKAVESVYENIRLARLQEPCPLYPDIVPLDKWMALYRNSKRVRTALLNIYGTCPDESCSLFEMQNVLTAFSSVDPLQLKEDLNKLTPQEWQDAWKMGGDWMKEIWKNHRDSLQEKSCNEFDKALAEGVHHPEIAFFFRVYFPCWIEYGITVTRLMRQARNGDLDAIEKICRLDSSAIHEPRIRGYVHAINLSGKRDNLKIVTDAMNGVPSKRHSMQKIKMSLAAYISRMSECLGKRLNESELKDLFDAVAKDKGQNCDTDWPTKPETASKEIQRERKFWKMLPNPTKEQLAQIAALRKNAPGGPRPGGRARSSSRAAGLRSKNR